MENEIVSRKITGERGEYFSSGKNYFCSAFADGESQLKHSVDVNVSSSIFGYKYPLWKSKNVQVKDSSILDSSRAGIWYSENLKFENVLISSPKNFRRCRNVSLKNVNFTNAAETFWHCSGVEFQNVSAKGDYFFMNGANAKIENFSLDGNYSFDGAQNIEIRNSRLLSKDAFWNAKNVCVYDSFIAGEYLGWEAENLKFVNCTIESDQGLCYVRGLKMENCRFVGARLAFEYSSEIDAEISGGIESVKNPSSGRIRAEEIGTLILNPERCNPDATKIECKKIGETLFQDPNENER
jgi:hypothetical protein